MQPWFKRLLSIFALVSRIPVRFEETPDYSRADFFLPVVGMAAGFLAIGAYSIADLIFLGPIPPALVCILVQYLAFNLFHFDGLLDSADALLPFASKERRLEILEDPRVGSYAVFAGIAIILARLGALSEPSVSTAAAIMAAPVVGRLAAAFVPLAANPAKAGGLGALMKGFKIKNVGLGFMLSILPATIVAGIFDGFAAALFLGAAGAIVAVAVGVMVAYRYVRSVGGFTGDALGAAVELGEVVFLLVYAAAGFIL